MRSDALYLVDILEAVDAVSEFVAETRREDFVEDDLVRSAVLQKLLIVGEAATRITRETKEKYSTVPWQMIIGFRNVAVHTYFSIQWAIVWRISTEDIPALRTAVRAILQKDFPDTLREYEKRSQI